MSQLLPESEFHIDALRTDDGVRLQVTGEIDLDTADTLRNRLAWAAEGEPILLDLSRVTHLGSVGISVLAEALRLGLDLHLVSTSSTVDRVLDLAGLGDWF
jgi:anti-anti-sigma factor